jgi:hypothetical protein
VIGAKMNGLSKVQTGPKGINVTIKQHTRKVDLNTVITTVVNCSYNALPPAITPPCINGSSNLDNHFLFFIRWSWPDGRSARLSHLKFIRLGQLKSRDPLLKKGDQDEVLNSKVRRVNVMH